MNAGELNRIGREVEDDWTR